MSVGEERRLADVLVDAGLVEQARLEEAQKRHGSGRELLRELVQEGVIAEERLTRTLSAAVGVEIVTPATIKIHERVIALVPKEIARKHGVLPIAVKRSGSVDYLYVAMADPFDREGRARVAEQTGCKVSVLVAPPSQLDEALNRYYRPSNPVSSDLVAPRVPRLSGTVPPESVSTQLEELEIVEVPPDAIILDGEDPRDQLRAAIMNQEASPAGQWDLEPVPRKPRPRRPSQSRKLSAPQRPIDLAATLDEPIPPVAIEDDEVGDTQLDVSMEDLMARSRGSSPLPMPQISEPAPAPGGAQPVAPRPFEVPVTPKSVPSPFDGLKNVHVQAGLDRTGIIPAIDWNKEEFEPPPLAEPAPILSQPPIPPITDIPKSEAEIRLRAGGTAGSSKSQAKVPSAKPVPVPIARKTLPDSHEPLVEASWQDLVEDSVPSLPPPKTGGAASMKDDRAGRIAAAVTKPQKVDLSAPPASRSLDIEVGDLGEPETSRIAPAAKPRAKPIAEATTVPQHPNTPAAKAAKIAAAETVPQKPNPIAPASTAPQARPAALQDDKNTNDEAGAERELVSQLLAGRSLTSADRARLILAIGRLLIDKQIISEEELVQALRKPDK